jgi:hypothetical protein
MTASADAWVHASRECGPRILLTGRAARRPLTLTKTERARCRAVVATADRINIANPVPRIWPHQVPPPSDGPPEPSQIGWAVFSCLIVAAFVLAAFRVASH